MSKVRSVVGRLPKGMKPVKAAKPKADGEKKGIELGYKGHKAGSRFEAVHKVFDTKGLEAAKKKAVELGLKEVTAGIMCTRFAKEAAASKK